VPVWIATFWLANLWMRGAGIDRFARWVAMGVAVCSSLLMIPAVEYRVDSLGCMLVMAGLVLAQRERFFLAGVVFCLAGFANLRLGPVLVVAVLLVLLTTRLRAWPVAAGGFVTLMAWIAFFAATDSLHDLVQQVWTDNRAERYAAPVIGGFIHRLLVPFGVRRSTSAACSCCCSGSRGCCSRCACAAPCCRSWSCSSRTCSSSRR
jgi:hypothetical protein